MLQFDQLSENPDFCEDVGSDIWLMDDHKWALSVWNTLYRASGRQKFSLVHADYHWDGINDFHGSPEMEQKLIEADEPELAKLIREDKWIRFDSFIAPAIILGVISEVLFFCRQDDGFDIGIDEALLSRCGAGQFIFTNVESLITHHPSSPVIFDLCLDLFNRSKMYYQGDIWSETEIMDFLTATKKLIVEAKLVTVSLSFGYSGTEDDTRRLAKLVVPVLKEWRQ